MHVGNKLKRSEISLNSSSTHLETNLSTKIVFVSFKRVAPTQTYTHVKNFSVGVARSQINKFYWIDELRNEKCLWVFSKMHQRVSLYKLVKSEICTNRGFKLVLCGWKNLFVVIQSRLWFNNRYRKYLTATFFQDVQLKMDEKRRQLLKFSWWKINKLFQIINMVFVIMIFSSLIVTFIFLQLN